MPRKKTVSEPAAVSTKYTVIERLKNAARVQKAENERALLPTLLEKAKAADDAFAALLLELPPPAVVYLPQIWTDIAGEVVYQIDGHRLALRTGANYFTVSLYNSKGTMVASGISEVMQRLGRLLAADEDAAQAAK